MIYTLIILSLLFTLSFCGNVDHKLSRIWGPGLNADQLIMPARYIFIETVNSSNERTNSSLEDFKILIEGKTIEEKPCRIWSQTLDRKDGSFIIRYKLYDKCHSIKISILYLNKHVSDSPYLINNKEILSDSCNCPKFNLERILLNEWNCGGIPDQITRDLSKFEQIDWNVLRKRIIEKYDQPYAISLCHYVIKNNEVYRNCYGKYVGFKMFMDNILLSLRRKAILPDVEFFVNLGDWPLVRKKENYEDGLIYPIFAWCGSEDTYDIVMPTYDVTESTLENMGRVTLDMLSIQGNANLPWKERISKAFWRGRDSSRERLKLIDISRNFPDLFNCSLTNFFFFKDEEKIYGPKVDHISFYKFFEYKYQIGIDGTVAAYRFPYLLAGGSLIFKQESKYYEHFYKDLEPYVHYVPIKNNLDDLVEKIEWAIDNDGKAEEIARNGMKYANENLLPKNIFCYHFHLLNEFSKRIISDVEILEGMEKVVEQTKHNEESCDCILNKLKDEL